MTTRNAPRLMAFFSAAVVTLVMLGGVNGLARPAAHAHAAQLSQAAAAPKA